MAVHCPWKAASWEQLMSEPMENFGLPQLALGSLRSCEACRNTVSVLTGKLKELSAIRGRRLLDGGCGVTASLSSCRVGLMKSTASMSRKPGWIAFAKECGRAPSFGHSMSAETMNFPDHHFDTVVSIETIGHIPDLVAAVGEISRVVRPGREVLITCPNRWFPFETHG